jgi:signal transduction histidine kinase
MIRRRPDLLAIVVALLGTLAVAAAFLGDLLLSRGSELEVGERRIQEFGIMVGEHTARSFEAVDILLREIATDLSEVRRDWPAWDPRRGYEYLAKRHSQSLPQLRDLILFDREGLQRFISTYFPTPRINVRDRPYFVAIEQGQAATTFGPYIGRNSGRYTYALARRIEDGRRNFAGVAFAAIEPAYFQHFCWTNRLADDFESVIINARGQVIASCRPTDLGKQATVVGTQAEDTLYGGRLRGWLPEAGVARGNGLIASLSPVPGFADLRVLTAIPTDTLLVAWRLRFLQLGTLFVLVSAVLVAGGLLVRRQIGELRAMADELAASRDQLEERVRAATAEVSRQRDEAETASKAKSRFLAAASHDLRQPLHALSLFAADLQHRLRGDSLADLPHVADQIAASTKTLAQLFDALLDISRLDVAGIAPDIRPFALDRLLERVVASYQPAAVDRQQTLVFRPTRLWAESDPLMVERMVANLLANALRYSGPGGHVLVAARRRAGKVLVEVRDNGPGIAAEHQAAIFAEFYQVGNRARETGRGLGLGLSIVDRLARALGVEVRLRSAPGRGTTFGLLLAAARPLMAANRTRPPEVPALHFVGAGDDLRAAMELARNWDYAISHDPQATGTPPAGRGHLVVVTLASLADVVAAIVPPGTPVITLADTPGHSPPPGNTYALPLPLRPAGLRALLGQIQKTLAKSTG